MAEETETIGIRYGMRHCDSRYYHFHTRCSDWHGLSQRDDYGEEEVETPLPVTHLAPRLDSEGREGEIRLWKCGVCTRAERVENEFK